MRTSSKKHCDFCDEEMSEFSAHIGAGGSFESDQASILVNITNAAGGNIGSRSLDCCKNCKFEIVITGIRPLSLDLSPGSRVVSFEIEDGRQQFKPQTPPRRKQS